VPWMRPVSPQLALLRWGAFCLRLVRLEGVSPSHKDCGRGRGWRVNERPDIDRLAETIEDEAATLYGNGDVRFDGRDALASLKAALDELVALAREGLRIQADEHEAIPGPKWWREHTEAAEARVAELEAALRDTLTEIDELGTAYTALRKKHEPPYIVYIPWSRPAALAVLAGDGGEN